MEKELSSNLLDQGGTKP